MTRLVRVPELELELEQALVPEQALVRALEQVPEHRLCASGHAAY